MLNIEKINNISVEPIRVKEPVFTSNKELFPFWFQIILMCGNRGFGKTNLALQLLNLQKEYIDYVYLVSPNNTTDPKVMTVMKNIPHTSFDILTNDIVEDIKKSIDRRIEMYLKGKKLLKLIKKMNNKEDKTIKLNDEEYEFLEELNDDEIPECLSLASKGRPPTSVLWCDDQIGCPLIHKRDGELIKMVIKNRHRYLTCIFATQSLKSISPVIRKNASVFFIAPTMDKKYRQDIFTEVEGAVKKFDTFEEIMNEVAKEPYQFLMVFNNGKQSDLRINLDRKINI